jgi:hypothetical protein
MTSEIPIQIPIPCSLYKIRTVDDDGCNKYNTIEKGKFCLNLKAKYGSFKGQLSRKGKVLFPIVTRGKLPWPFVLFLLACRILQETLHKDNCDKLEDAPRQSNPQSDQQQRPCPVRKTLPVILVAGLCWLQPCGAHS